MTDPVGANESDGRYSTLRQAPRILDRGGRGADVVGHKLVLEHVQQRRDILLDAGIKQLLDEYVATQLRNVAGQQFPDLVAELG